MKLSLTKGRTKWVDQHEARMLQRAGQVICVLAIRNEELAEFPTFCSIKNDYCSSFVSLPDQTTDGVWDGGGTFASPN